MKMMYHKVRQWKKSQTSNDKALEINFIDSSQINPKEYASADVELPDMPSFSKDASEFEGINMFKEQEKDPEIRALRQKINKVE